MWSKLRKEIRENNTDVLSQNCYSTCKCKIEQMAIENILKLKNIFLYVYIYIHIEVSVMDKISLLYKEYGRLG